MKRLIGEEGYLYLGELGTVQEGSATPVDLSDEGYFKIISIGAASGLPEGLKVKDVFYNKPAVSLQEGDAVMPMSLTKIAFVTNIPVSGSKTKHAHTTQMDDVKSFTEGRRAELSGNIDGYLFDDIPLQWDLISRYLTVIEDDGAGSITAKTKQTDPLHCFLSRMETNEVGAQEIMQYMPLITDSLTMDKPLEGPQVLNFNYTLVGSERPNMYLRTITA